jgi:hypothetical protein
MEGWTNMTSPWGVLCSDVQKYILPPFQVEGPFGLLLDYRTESFLAPAAAGIAVLASVFYVGEHAGGVS